MTINFSDQMNTLVPMVVEQSNKGERALHFAAADTEK